MGLAGSTVQVGQLSVSTAVLAEIQLRQEVNFRKPSTAVVLDINGSGSKQRS